jgi:flavin-dependent dehydrogenase
VLEAGGYAGPRIGETVSPALMPLLDYLGAAIPDDALLPCYGSEAAWGSVEPLPRASIFSGEGAGWSLDRRRFDLSLAEAAEAGGAVVARHSVLREVERDPSGGWALSVEHRRRTHRILARQVIDASGRRAAFARRAGAVRSAGDRLVAAAAFLTYPAGANHPQTLLVEAEADGWWYMAGLPGGGAVAAYLTDADLIRRSGKSLEALFVGRLAATAHVAARVAGATERTAPHIHLARSQRLDRCAGPGWLAAGDAASSFDPLSSLGIGHALASGIQAARIVHARLDGDETLALAYPGDVVRIHQEHDRRLALIYAAERRWPDRPFWRRRNGIGLGGHGNGDAPAAFG